MKKFFRKRFSLLLAVLLIFQNVPITAMAEESNEIPEAPVESITEQETVDAAESVEEENGAFVVESKSTETSKTEVTETEESIEEETAAEEAIVLNSSVVDSGTCGENLKWNLNSDGTLTISGSGEMYDMYESDYYTDIPWADYKTDITSIVLGNSVSTIGAYAFTGLTSLTTVTIPAGIEYIGEGAFAGCSQMKAFQVDEDNECYCSVDGILYNKDQTELINYPNQKDSIFSIPSSVTDIAYGAFFACDNLTEVTIPDTVSYIGGSAFGKCENLTELAVPDEVAAVGEYAFADCSKLADIQLSAGLTSLSMGMLKKCSSLTEIMIPEAVEMVDASAFKECSSLSQIYFTGNAPEFCMADYNYYTTFKGVTATAFYPAGNETWTDELFQNYGGSLTWLVELPDSEVTDVVLNKAPDCDKYYIGEELDLSGLLLDVVFANGETRSINKNMVTTGAYDFSSAGEKTITVYYQDFAVQFNVTVLSAAAVEIPSSEYPESSHPYHETIAIGNPLMLSPDFPPL